MVPNLFGKPTILVVGGGRQNSDQDEVVTAYPYVESAQVILVLKTKHYFIIAVFFRIALPLS